MNEMEIETKKKFEIRDLKFTDNGFYRHLVKLHEKGTNYCSMTSSYTKKDGTYVEILISICLFDKTLHLEVKERSQEEPKVHI